MSPLHRRYQMEFYQILALCFALLVIFGGGSMTLLFMRQQISETANATERVQREIVESERRIRYLDTKIAEVHQPSYLNARIAQLGLNLRPPRNNEIQYLNGPKIEVIRDRDGEDLFAERDPFRHSIDIAVMEPLRGFN